MIDALSLVIPAHDEESRLPRTLELAARELPRLARSCEIVVVDDGSRDRTAEVARLADGPVPVVVVRLETNRGKGAAVAEGIARSRHPVVAFTDADCPYELGTLAPSLVELAAGRLDIAIGARDLPGSEINRGYGPLRFVSGQVLSFLTWLAIGLPFRDSQCGLKAFRREIATKLFGVRTVEGFGFDFEVLAAAVANGLRIARFPVRLTHNDDSRVSVVTDSARMLRDLWRVRRNLGRGLYRFTGSDGASASPCPLCGDRRFAPLFFRDGFRMVACEGCGLWQINPMPHPDQLEAVYSDEYFASDEAGQVGYADYAAMADDFRATFRRRLALVAGREGSGRILDVGGGFGFLADAAEPTFSERWVVERSAAAGRRISPAHRVVLGAFPEVELPSGYFDVVSLQDCLEHLPEPRAALARVRAILRPGGAVLLTTPNVGSWLARTQGANWVSLKFPEHVILYSRDTLRRLLEGEGFRVERMVPARQQVSVRFIASRVASGRPGLARGLERVVGRLGVAERRLSVSSGSLVAVATRG